MRTRDSLWHTGAIWFLLLIVCGCSDSRSLQPRDGGPVPLDAPAGDGAIDVWQPPIPGPVDASVPERLPPLDCMAYRDSLLNDGDAGALDGDAGLSWQGGPLADAPRLWADLCRQRCTVVAPSVVDRCAAECTELTLDAEESCAQRWVAQFEPFVCMVVCAPIVYQRNPDWVPQCDATVTRFQQTLCREPDGQVVGRAPLAARYVDRPLRLENIGDRVVAFPVQSSVTYDAYTLLPTSNLPALAWLDDSLTLTPFAGLPPVRIFGAAEAADGTLWVSAVENERGRLLQLDTRGSVLQQANLVRPTGQPSGVAGEAPALLALPQGAFASKPAFDNQPSPPAWIERDGTAHLIPDLLGVPALDGAGQWTFFTQPDQGSPQVTVWDVRLDSQGQVRADRLRAITLDREPLPSLAVHRHAWLASGDIVVATSFPVNNPANPSVRERLFQTEIAVYSPIGVERWRTALPVEGGVSPIAALREHPSGAIIVAGSHSQGAALHVLEADGRTRWSASLASARVDSLAFDGSEHLIVSVSEPPRRHTVAVTYRFARLFRFAL